MRRVALVTFLSSVAVTVLYGAVLVTVAVTMGTPLLPIAVNSLIVAMLAAATILSGVWALDESRVARLVRHLDSITDGPGDGLDGYAAGYADGLARTPAANGKVTRFARRS